MRRFRKIIILPQADIRKEETTAVMRRSFTLFETLVGVIVLGLIMVVMTRVLISAQMSWSKQSTSATLIRDARWALERITNETRDGENVHSGVVSGVKETLCFEIDTDGDNNPDIRIWYWRGQTVSPWYYGDPNILYRGVDNFMWPNRTSSLREAKSNRERLANFIVDNPGNAPIFSDDGSGLITIELTLRPKPSIPEQKWNRNITLRTKVRVRNP